MRGLSPLTPLLLLAAAAPYALAATGAPRERVLAAETSRGADASGGSALSGGGGALRAEPVSGDGGVALGALGAEPLSVASLPSVGCTWLPWELRLSAPSAAVANTGTGHLDTK